MSKCGNCGAVDKWQSVNHLRYDEKDKHGKSHNMCICTECGFVTYPDKIKDKAKLKEYYKKEYRPAPTIHNSFTGQRKNHFHFAFLKDHMEAWAKSGNTKPVICDVGTAYGMSLNMFQQIFPEADINGVELTETMKRVAFHEFGYKLTDEIDESKKYDLIMSYKVLEHMIDPMEELERYGKLLKPDGVLYISVPTWFNSLGNFGLEGFDLKYYYDPNHINCWTVEMFESMLERTGFVIIKQDNKMYGDTYLCVYTGHKTSNVYKDDLNVIISKMESIKKAYEYFIDHKFKEAIDTYPNYPSAWASYLEMNRKSMAEKGFDYFNEQFLQPMYNATEGCAEALMSMTDFHMRAKKFEQALDYANQLLALKPNTPTALRDIINCYRELGARSKDEKAQVHYFKKAKEAAIMLFQTSSQNRDDAISTIYLFSSLIPVES